MKILRIKEVTEIAKHKIMFLRVRRKNSFLRGNISLVRALMHDLGKMLNVIIFGDNVATSIHRKMAGHHQADKMNFSQKVEAFCDWECARFSKPDKPLSGIETWAAYYAQVDMLEICVKFQRAKTKSRFKACSIVKKQCDLTIGEIARV